MSNPLCNIAAIVLVLALPYCLYLSLRRSYVADKGFSYFSSLWNEGVITFICGGLIASVVSLIYMIWIEPGFVSTRAELLIKAYDSLQIPEAAELSTMLRAARDQHMLPRPIDMTLSLLWLSIVLGTILSLPCAAFARIKKVKPSAPQIKK